MTHNISIDKYQSRVGIPASKDKEIIILPEMNGNALAGSFVAPRKFLLSGIKERSPVNLAKTDPLIPTIFHENWWLNIVTHGICDVVETHDAKGKVNGRFPFCIRNNLGIKRLVMPPLTHFLGPAVSEGTGSVNTRFQKRLSITQELIEKLPHASSYNIKCHRGVADVIAFQSQRYKTAVQFTHEIAPRPVEEIWMGIQSKRRNIITRAQKEMDCVEIADATEYMALSRKNLAAYGMHSYFDLDMCSRLLEESLAHGQARITGTRDRNGNLIAALFCIWDHSAYYYFLNTRRPSAPKGAMSVLIWDAIKDAMNKGLIFDLDGVSTEESVAFYSGFGASVVPRYIANRQTKLMGMARSMQHLFKKTNYYC